jgi:hypothetical protein
MELTNVIAELQLRREQLNHAIQSLERLSLASPRKRGRPPKWATAPISPYTMTLKDPKSKKPMADKYISVYRKQADGSSKALADTCNSDTAVYVQARPLCGPERG